jgi:bacterioferritin
MASIYPSMSIEAIQEIFRVDVAQDAIESENLIDKAKLVEQLNEVFVFSTTSMLRFRRHYLLAQKFKMKHITDSFIRYSIDKQEHAHWVANRIVQLNGMPDFSSSSIVNTADQAYAVDNSLPEMLIDDLLASQLAIAQYRDIIMCLGKEDPATRLMLNIILLDEQKHAEALEEFIQNSSTQH